MHQREFFNKCPSIAQIKKAIKEFVAEGATHIQVIWGENQITLEKQTGWIGHDGPWAGGGWIRRHGGQDIADAMNKELRDVR